MSSERHKSADREKQHRVGYDLVPIELIEAAAEGLEYGATKYAPRGWERGQPLVAVCCSLIRHTFALMRGEDIDPSSGQPHVNLICANAAILAKLWRTGPKIDNRR